MLSLGIDLAAQPSGTGACLIEWAADGASVRRLEVGADDDRLLALIGGSDITGIDAPFGWPDEFVEAVAAHRSGEAWPGRELDQDAYRFRLAFRETDRRLIEQGARRPLSVSTDLIGVVAMRCAALLDRLAAEGRAVARDGSGPVLEVYPAPALAAWGINTTGYKSRAGAGRLPALLDALEEALGGLDLSPEERGLATTDHNCFDAIVSSLVARAAAVGLTFGPGEGEQAERAAREGWIHPANPLGDLLEAA